MSSETSVALVYKLQDLMLRSVIEEACSKAGVQIAYCNSKSDLKALLDESRRKGSKILVICNLVMNEDELDELVRTAKNFQAKILGFYPHVNKEAEKRALALGVDIVVPRSSFSSKLRILISSSSEKGNQLPSN
jgi:DNA-binding NarL/FixJ family response regulator